MKYFVAPSYQDMEMIKIDENAHKAYMKGKCPRCGGLGIIVSHVENGRPIPIPVDGGICYQCNGNKYIYKWVKAYTEDEYNKYMKSQERTREKKQQKIEAERQAKMINSEKNKVSLLEKWGYDSKNPLIWLVGGGSTYEIKDQLKELGCKFDPDLGWYCSHAIDVPEGYGMVSINFFDVYTWKPMIGYFTKNENVKDIAAAAVATLKPESHSEYIGEIKERLRDLKVTFTGARTFEGFYGTTYIYTFKYGENTLVWMTSSCKNINVGEEILLAGTVKEHKEYQGEKQTYLSRCNIKEVE